MGISPDGFTLRELLWMAEGRQRDAWNHTAQVLAMLYNAFRSRGSRALGPRDFHPFDRRIAATATLRDLVAMGVLRPREQSPHG